MHIYPVINSVLCQPYAGNYYTLMLQNKHEYNILRNIKKNQVSTCMFARSFLFFFFFVVMHVLLE